MLFLCTVHSLSQLNFTAYTSSHLLYLQNQTCSFKYNEKLSKCACHAPHGAKLPLQACPDCPNFLEPGQGATSADRAVPAEKGVFEELDPQELTAGGWLGMCERGLQCGITMEYARCHAQSSSTKGLLAKVETCP